MSSSSRRLAGILMLVFPTVIFGGASILAMMIGDPAYLDNPIRRDLWRAGHAHAGVLLILSLVVLRYVDETRLSPGVRTFARLSVPVAAVMLPIAFFSSVLSAEDTEPGVIVYLAYAGAVVLVAGLLTVGVGLLRRPQK